MPVFQYLALHRPAGAAQTEVEHAILYLCQRLKLVDKLSRTLTQLSGGEWQRVRLAAVLLQVWPSVNPHSRLLLLDEPTNSLDVAQRSRWIACCANSAKVGAARWCARTI